MSGSTKDHKIPWADPGDKLSAWPAVSKTVATKLDDAITTANLAQGSAEEVFEHVKRLKPIESAAQGLGPVPFDLDTVTDTSERFGMLAKSAKLNTQVAVWTLRTYRGTGNIIQELDGVPFTGTTPPKGTRRMWYRYVTSAEDITAAEWKP